jgi:acyl carrier protein
MEQEVREVLAEVGRLAKPVESIKTNDDLHDAGLTSLATVNVMLGLEDKFEVEFPDEFLNRQSFASIAALVRTVTIIKNKK